MLVDYRIYWTIGALAYAAMFGSTFIRNMSLLKTAAAVFVVNMLVAYLDWLWS